MSWYSRGEVFVPFREKCCSNIPSLLHNLHMERNKSHLCNSVFSSLIDHSGSNMSLSVCDFKHLGTCNLKKVKGEKKKKEERNVQRDTHTQITFPCDMR